LFLSTRRLEDTQEVAMSGAENAGRSDRGSNELRAVARLIADTIPRLVDLLIAVRPGGLHREALEVLERPLLAHALALTGGNQLRAARLLGLNRNTLRKRCRELGLGVPRASRNTATPKPAPLA
jgi:DNA-binding protein Fis